MAMLRPNRLHTFLASMLALGLLAGCAVRPAPLTERDTAERVAEDRRALAANRPALNGPLTLHRAMAYALLYNLNSRVKAMEQALALGELEAGRLGLLPGLSARYGGDDAQQCPGLVEPFGADRAGVAERVELIRPDGADRESEDGLARARLRRLLVRGSAAVGPGADRA